MPRPRLTKIVSKKNDTTSSRVPKPAIPSTLTTTGNARTTNRTTHARARNPHTSSRLSTSRGRPINASTGSDTNSDAIINTPSPQRATEHLVVMSGGLGTGDASTVDGFRNSQSRSEKQKAEGLLKVAREADYAAERTRSDHVREGPKTREKNTRGWKGKEKERNLADSGATAPVNHPVFEEDDFQPEDESTPIHRGSSRLRHEHRAAAMPPHVQSMEDPRLQAKKMELQNASQAVRNSPPELPSHPIRVSTLPDQPLVRSSPINRLDEFSDTMAPPLSDSGDDDHELSRHKPSSTEKKQRVSSVRQEPTKPKKISKKRAEKGELLSTVHLQAQLPRRRHRNQRHVRHGPYDDDDDDDDGKNSRFGDGTMFDIPTDSSAADDDLDEGPEEDRDPSKTFGSRNGNPCKSKARAALKGAAKKSSQSVSQQGNRMTKQISTKSMPATITKVTKTPKITKTYMRRSTVAEASEKENAPDLGSPSFVNHTVDSSLSASPSPRRTPRHANAKTTTKRSEEMAAMARKFAEVDQWALEFEDISACSKSDSSRLDGAR